MRTIIRKTSKLEYILPNRRPLYADDNPETFQIEGLEGLCMRTIIRPPLDDLLGV